MIRLRPSGVDEILIKRVQDWYEPGPGVFIQSLTASFSPAMLFTGSTTGAWYDPSDLTTLYRDAAGTLPVTAMEQPVGLMLDKSKGLVQGPELVTNGDFSNGTTGWTAYNSASLSVNNGMLRVTNTAAAYGGCYQAVTTTIGKWYKFSVAFQKQTATTVYFSLRQTASDASQTIQIPSTDTSGVINFYWYSTYATAYVNVQVNNANGVYADFDNISVRELPGNHAFNSSGNSANFPVLSARYNLLTKSEQFDDVVWAKTSGVVVTDNAALAPNGTLTADKFTAANNSSESGQLAANSAKTVTASIYVKKGTTGYFFLQLVNAVSGGNAVRQFFNLDTGAVATAQTFGTGFEKVSASITPDSDGWYRANLTCTVPAANCALVFSTSSTDAPATIAAGQTLYIWGADLRVANDALNQPAYQRVNTSTDYDTVGFKPYLRFNGTNQWLQTNSIDFTYGDKMFVSAGVRKLSDAATGITCELSAAAFSNNGGFVLAGPGSTASAYSVGTRGTAFASLYFAAAAPTTNVVSAALNIAGATVYDEITIKNNGATASAFVETAGPAGTGNFGNYPFYIGARGGTSLWFNGRLYQMVVAGKQASAAEITSTETYINQKTGAF